MKRKTKIYSLERPEKVYSLPYEAGEIPEDSQDEISREEIKGYRIKTTISGEYVESEVFPNWKRRSDVPKEKESRSTAAQMKLNEKNAVKKITRLANANFSEKDIWATFTYDNAHLPESMEEAQRDIRNYLRRLKRAYAKKGLTLKYIYVTECHEPGKEGKSVRYHHHIILSGGISRDEIEKIWNHGGRTQTRRLQPDEYGIAGLAAYVAKAPAAGAHRWAASKNLVLPVMRKADTKTSKKQVRQAVRGYAELEQYFRKLYPKYEITDIAPPAFNAFNGGTYLYCRMRKKVGNK